MTSTSQRIQGQRYHLVGRVALGDDKPSARVWFCRDCGSLVGSMTIHNQWHRQQEKTSNP